MELPPRRARYRARPDPGHTIRVCLEFSRPGWDRPRVLRPAWHITHHGSRYECSVPTTASNTEHQHKQHLGDTQPTHQKERTYVFSTRNYRLPGDQSRPTGHLVIGGLLEIG